MSAPQTAEQPLEHSLPDDAKLSEAVRAFWPKLRDATATTFAAFLAEAHVFSLFRRAGVKHVKGCRDSETNFQAIAEVA